jgi:adenylate cyclase
LFGSGSAGLGVSIPLVETERAKRKHPNSHDAWDHYLLAAHELRGLTYEGYCKAVRHLELCILLEPSFSLGHARLAIAKVRAAHYGWGGEAGTVTIAQAHASATTAISLDPDSALALDALASVCLFRGEHDSAAAFAQRAVEIDPSMTAAYGTMVNALAFAGRSDEALAAFECCCRVSPRDPDRSGLLMGRLNALFVARQFSECISAARALLANRPNWYGGYVALAVVYAHLGEHAQAAEAAAQLLKLVPRFTLERARGRPYYKRPEDVELLIEGLRVAGVPEV